MKDKVFKPDQPEEPEPCNYWDCIMCHWGCCTGDKQFAIELNLCQKEKEEDKW